MKQLKEKLPIYRRYIDYYLSQDSFKEVFIFTIILVFYGGLSSVAYTDIFTSITSVYRSGIFLMGYYIIIVLNCFFLNSFLENNLTFYNIRIGKKKNILKDKIIISIIITLYYNIIIFLLFFSFIYFLHRGRFDFSPYLNYGISKFTFLIYFLVRTVLLSILVSTINITLYEKVKLKFFLIDIFLLLGMVTNTIKMDLKYTFNIFDILAYSNFYSMKYDLYATVFCLFVLFMTEFILYKITYRK